METTTSTTITRGSRKRWLTMLLVPAAALALGACANNPGMSQEDVTAIKNQIEDVANRLDAVEQRLMEVSQENDTEVLISDVRDVSNDVAEAKNMLDDVSARLSVSEPAEDAGNDGLLDSPLDSPANDSIENDGGILDDARDLGDDVNDGLNDLDDNVDDLGNDLNDSLNGSDSLDSAPLEDPLVPSQDNQNQAPGL